MKNKRNEDEILKSASDFGNAVLESNFPLNIFPEDLQYIIRQLNEHCSYNIEYTACSMLCALGLAIGSAFKVSPSKCWVESAVIYIAIVGNSGTNKSHPIKFAFKYFDNLDKESMRKYKEERAMFESCKGRNGYGTTPMYKCYVTSNATKEAVMNVLNYNQHGIAFVSDELMTFINSMDSYTNTSDVSFWLTMFDGEQISVDRKTDNERILIPDPFCSVIGSIQPYCLSVMTHSSLAKSGFTSRFLFSYPRNQKKPEIHLDKDLPDDVEMKWNEILCKLVNMHYETDDEGTIQSNILRLTEEAKRTFESWCNLKNKPCCDNTDNEMLKSTYSKFDKYFLRFSLILQLTRWACNEGASNEFVDDISVKNAILLVEYFRDQVMRVLKVVRVTELDKRHEDLLEALPANFKTAQANEIGGKIGFSKSSIRRFLDDNEGVLIQKERHGEYSKLI